MFKQIGLFVVALIVLPRGITIADELDPTAAKIFQGMSGSRDLTINFRTSKWFPEPKEHRVIEIISPILKGRFLLGRALNETGWESFFLIGYDDKTKSFPMTFFAADVCGGHWNGSWDEKTQHLNAQATDTPQGWTSKGVNLIRDGDNPEASAWMKDETGALLLDALYTKKKLAKEPVDPVLTKWNYSTKGDPAKPESKIFDRMIGAWDAELVYAPSAWYPEEKRATRVTRSQYVVNGNFLFSMAQDSDGGETLFVIGVQPHEKAIKYYRFTSQKGEAMEMTGSWDELAGSLTMKSKINDLDFRIVQRFLDENKYDWRGAVTDPSGKVYFDMTGKATRKKE